MQRYLPWILTVLLFFTLSGHFVLAQELRGPKIVLKEQMFDFGEVKEGDTIDHTFQVFNKGDQTLEIKNVKPG